MPGEATSSTRCVAADSSLDTVPSRAVPAEKLAVVAVEPFDGAEHLLYFNGLGGFDIERREYVIVLDGTDSTPRRGPTSSPTSSSVSTPPQRVPATRGGATAETTSSARGATTP